MHKIITTVFPGLSRKKQRQYTTFNLPYPPRNVNEKSLVQSGYSALFRERPHRFDPDKKQAAIRFNGPLPW